MNNIKRGLQLGGAIAGIVVAAFLLLYPIYQVASAVIGLDGGLAEIFAILFTTQMVLPVICLLITSVASIVIHSLLCKNPAKKGKEKNYFIMTIVAIVLNVLLFVVYLAFFQWAWGLIPLAVAGLLAATIFLKDAKAA